MQRDAAHFVDRGLEPLRDILDEFVLVGGASIGLLLDSPVAPPARPTNDIDLVVMCHTRVAYHAVADRLRARGLSEDSTSNVICRWRSGAGMIVDVMPVNEAIFGFANHWYEDAFDEATGLTLPSGAELKVATTPYLLATKLEAFDDDHRADGGDHLVSADMYDVMALLDGRIDIADDFDAARGAVCKAARQRFRQLTTQQIQLALLNYLPPDASAAERSLRIKDANQLDRPARMKMACFLFRNREQMRNRA